LTSVKNLPLAPFDRETRTIVIGQAICVPNGIDIRDVLPSETNPEPYIETIIQTISFPISGIRVYRGTYVVKEIKFPMDKIRGT
jgi:hypothetical protein